MSKKFSSFSKSFLWNLWMNEFNLWTHRTQILIHQDIATCIMRFINCEETFFVHLLPFHVHIKFNFFLFIREKFFINLGNLHLCCYFIDEEREREVCTCDWTIKLNTHQVGYIELSSSSSSSSSASIYRCWHYTVRFFKCIIYISGT